MHRHILALVALVLFLSRETAGAQAYGLSSRPSVGAYMDGVLPTVPPATPTVWSTAVAFPSLTFQNPMGLLPLPGTGKLVVWEREGRIWSFDNAAATATKTLILDLHNQCQGWDDEGLLGLAFHPNFASNHYFYVWYNWVTPGTVIGDANTRPPNATSTHQRLARFTYNPATGLADPASELVLIDQIDHNTWHNGGGLFFHAVNGFLYLTNGNDANGANDQIISKGFFGCLVRIDVDKRGGAISHAPTTRAFEEVSANWPQYYVPNDNPFVGVAGALEEIYGLGLRSPHRMTYDAVSNRIFIGDVGEGTKEEIDVIEPADPGGLNFQWHQIEGYNGDLTGTYFGVNKRPMIDYNHGADGNAVIGGYVYRGTAIPQLAGRYVFADNVSNRIYMLDESTHTATTPASKVYLTTMPKGPGPNSGTDYTGISSWGYDANNELYLCQLSSTGGQIYKLLATGGTGGGSTPLPATLSATGIFSDLPNLTPSPKLIPYSINAPFWSDGAIKSRWAVIPAATTVGFAPAGEWTFPTGSVFVKHFDLAADDTDSTIRRRLETRLLIKMAAGGVFGATYKWREDNSDADLLADASLTEASAISTAASLGTLTSADIGSPALAGSTSRTGDDLTITAGGADVWGTTDQFRFAYLQRTGDFDLRMKVNSITQAASISKIGLMARGSLAANSQYAYSITYPPAGGRAYDFEYRASDGGGAAASTVVGPGTAFPRWVRLRRAGNVFTSLTSTDGSLWTVMGSTTIAMPTTVYFGVAACALTGGATTTASVHLERDTRLQYWYYPSRGDCVSCHSQVAGSVLGLKTRQLNGPQLFPGTNVTDNQIRAWNHVGLFSNAPQESAIPGMDKLSAVGDATASLRQRARSYFDSNCSHCHRPGGAPSYWDARFDTPLLQQGIVNGQVGNNLGVAGSRIVTPQNLAHSALYSRVNLVGANQMPPLARGQIDSSAVSMLAAWINSLPAIGLGGATDGTTYLNSDSLTLTGSATAVGGSVSRVEFWDNGVKLGQSAGAPYTLTLPGPLPLGFHQITAVVYDSVGGVSPSSIVTLNVLPLQLSLLGFSGARPLLSTQIPSGRSYFIEYTDDLTTGWSTLQTGTANGQLLNLQDPAATRNHRFYRLRVLP